jgi:hypothetical protein
MDVKLTPSLRFLNGKAVPTKMEEVDHISQQGQKEMAYVIDPCRSYSLDLTTEEPGCSNDTWTFSLVRGVATCDDWEDHEQLVGEARMTIRTEEGNIEMAAFGLGKELQIGGGHKLRICFSFDDPSDCNVCDALFLRASHYACKGGEPRVVHVPILFELGE